MNWAPQRGSCFATAAIALLGLHCARSGPSGGTADAGAPRPRYWLMRASLSPTRNALATRVVEGPTLVELSEDGHVRSLPGAAEPLDGYLSANTLRHPQDRAGLMLYVQRTTELHLDSQQGPVIGKLHPGAFVSVAHARRAEGLVAVPRYRRTIGADSGALMAYVDPSALDTKKIDERPPSFPGKLVHDFPFSLRHEDGTVFVDTLLCGRLYVEQTKAAARLTQYYQGIEVSGLIESAWLWGDQGPGFCPTRKVLRGPQGLRLFDGRDWADTKAVSEIPPGFMPIAPPEEDPLASAIASGKSLFLLSPGPSGLGCRQWRPSAKWLRAGMAGKNGIFAHDTLEGELVARDEPKGTYYLMSYTPSGPTPSQGVLDLFGPYFKSTGTGYKCAVAYQLRAVERGVLFMEPPGSYAWAGSPPRDHQPIAFHPEDVERWYLTLDGCSSALAQATAALDRDPSARERLGLHIPCNNVPP